ncbi:efflux transporter outer membrane subunit [Sphingomonas sp.]|jgi:multidrug efflux system outer membrane protein|uniref:efflux transporter outer membrane subunit n=1 Tax=Sphingomonas sp. TaxID=28214 RepID=UPI002E353F0C|nr:efflux transporter outer membrane subunit [Sphingomonas sp.]HEX4693194.1 efflux transporter outer membrane subunit [Sphingomonas sp.]
MIRRAVTLTAIASLAACSLAPHYVRPDAPVPPSWPVGDAYLRSSEASLPAVRYQDIFRDLRLQAIIAQALANNRDLRVAAANIAIARGQYRVQRAELLPEVDASGGLTARNSGSGTTGTTASGGTGTGTTGSTGGGTRTSFDANVGITSFELDLFGRVRSLTSAAQARYFATEAAARATRLTLVGDIADAWLTYASDKSLLKIAQDTATSAQRSVDLTRMRLNGGIAPRTDLRQAQLVLDTARADLAQQTTALAQDVNALQLLVGAPVDPALLPNSIDEASATLAELPAGLDSTVLLRRPDVVEAEYQLRAANAEIGAARAELFPRITLTGLLGLASNALGALFGGGAFNWQAGANASYPIFRAGAGRANVAISQAQRDAAVATYEKTIQTAFREVSDALARRGTIGAQLTATRDERDAAADNYRLSDARYRGGIDNFLQSLDAQRSLYSAQRTLVTTQLTAASNLVTLYRTLGGDSLVEASNAGPQPLTPDPVPITRTK